MTKLGWYITLTDRTQRYTGPARINSHPVDVRNFCSPHLAE
jgi:hypothetical protein